MEKFNVLLGKRLRQLRENALFSREKLSEMANISTNYLGEIERGEVNVSALIVSRIADSIQVSLSDVYKLEHVQTRKTLEAEIHNLLEQAQDKEIELIYKVIRSILI